MNSRKKIQNYVTPPLGMICIMAIVLLLVFAFALAVNEMDNESKLPIALFFIGMVVVAAVVDLVPPRRRIKKSLDSLEAKGTLDMAARELYEANTRYAIRKRAALSRNFLFVKGYGACAYQDILWMYRHRQVNRVLFIPVAAYDSLHVHTVDRTYEIPLGKKDKNEELKQVMIFIYQHNSQILTGYTNENAAAYRSLRKQAH